MKHVIVAVCLVAATACSRTAERAAVEPVRAPAPATVVLISFDGTHAADVAALPTFARLAREGARADALTPAFPSNTFPNHATFVTGVAPDRHGIVNNVFVDPERGLYRYAADPTWLDVEPLWSLLARAGLPSASFHWVGSEGAWKSGLGPARWKRFDGGVAEADKVEQILAWLDEPDPAQRPRFVTAWFHGGDGTGHRFGPGARETAAALAEQDAALAQLVEGLAARGLLASTTLLVVSDHGMARVTRTLDLEAELGRAGVAADVVGGGGFATIRLREPEDAAQARDPGWRKAQAERAVAAARTLGLEAWPRGAGPPEYPSSHARFGDAVALAPLGTAIVDGTHALAAPATALGLGALRGIHGHRPELPEMAGIFFALGRGVAPGARPGVVRAVDVAPTVLALLAQPVPEWMEGRPVPLGAEPLGVDPR